jgi:RimJ/RimL family protein N-acetyltransferase
MAFALPGVTHVEIHHDVANPASGRVPAKLGFVHVSDEAHAIEAPGETGTQRIWRMERSAWTAPARRPAIS